MNTQNESNTQTDLSRVLAKITDIVEKSAEGDYIYRGESNKCHKKVSSNLYREYKADIEAENFDIAVVQEEILREAREYTTSEMTDSEILTELQHHGGKTNLIDFTTDYLVALFFACDGNRDKPGRVILVQRQSEAYEVVKPPRTIERVGFQKSIFVRSPSGVVEPDDVVYIPADLKGAMLHYLRKHHDISTKTIYNDLQGFIENQNSHKSAYANFYKGRTCQIRGDSTKDPVEKQASYGKAVEHYTEAIDLNPEYTKAYNNRGVAYNSIGEYDRALQDYNKAIDLKPELVLPYSNRGNVYVEKGEVDRAIQDYNKAIDLKPEYAIAYNNRGTAYQDIGKLDTAIQDYNKAIDLKPEYVDAYNNRGTAYSIIGDFDKAIQDYNKAIDLKPMLAEVYYNRGAAWLLLQEWENAKADLSTAKNMGFNIAGSFHNYFGNVAAFETKHGVKVPEDIAALLSRD